MYTSIILQTLQQESPNNIMDALSPAYVNSQPFNVL